MSDLGLGAGDAIGAVAALGTASMGLVDASKVMRTRGPSYLGFARIEQAITPFLPAEEGVGGRMSTLKTLRAVWMNGVALADQKAKARALVHLGLTVVTAEKLAAASAVDAATLTALADAIATGQAPTQAQVNVLGQFDVMLNAALDEGYDSADQIYRNGCKALAVAVSLVLAIVGGGIVTVSAGEGLSNFVGQPLLLSVIIGLCATPLAPVAKDLATALQAAVGAVGAVKGIGRS